MILHFQAFFVTLDKLGGASILYCLRSQAKSLVLGCLIFTKLLVSTGIQETFHYVYSLPLQILAGSALEKIDFNIVDIQQGNDQASCKILLTIQSLEV